MNEARSRVDARLCGVAVDCIDSDDDEKHAQWDRHKQSRDTRRTVASTLSTLRPASASLSSTALIIPCRYCSALLWHIQASSNSRRRNVWQLASSFDILSLLWSSAYYTKA